MVTRGKVSESQLAYLAGIVDGEGHFNIHKTRAGNQRCTNTRFQAEVIIVNSSYALMEWLIETFGSSICARKKDKAHYKQTWRWRIGANNAAELCRWLLPYLIIKKQQAELLIEFIDDRPEKPCRISGRGSKTPPEEQRRRERLWVRMSELNDRGGRPQRLTEEAFAPRRK